jgi:glycerol-3-phosphate dehydrogenase subunit C
LCDSFPRLFDLIDESETGELDSVKSIEFKPVVDACTLCDMCFMTKCPYVPPHKFDLDFPHLMLRYRAVEAKHGKVGFAENELTKTDRNGKIAEVIAPLANWASKCGNSLTRTLIEATLSIHKDANLPEFHSATFLKRAKKKLAQVNHEAPGFGRKAVIYATCFGNYNSPDIGLAARAVLAKNGVETEVVYPGCCGMPQLEQGDIAGVAKNAIQVAVELVPWIERGYDVISLVPSCTLMMKFEWPLIVPNDENLTKLSQKSYDISEYIVDISKKEGLAPGISPLEGGVSVHIACHARAQNMGQKAGELLRLLPDTEINLIERCSGHGGSWGIMKENFEVALKVGKPVARQAATKGLRYIVSECPLARDHIIQGMERLAENKSDTKLDTSKHPIELIAKAYGLSTGD